MAIKRAFRLFEYSNGRLEAQYLVFNAKGNVEKQEDIPTATLPGALVDLFFASPDQLPEEHLSAPTSTVGVEDVELSTGAPAGDEVGLKDSEEESLSVAETKPITKSKTKSKGKK